MLFLSSFTPANAGRISKTPSKETLITVTIKGIPATEQKRVNGEYQIVSQKLRLPYLKEEIHVAGLSNDKWARKIEEAYIKDKIYKKPTVSLLPWLK